MFLNHTFDVFRRFHPFYRNPTINSVLNNKIKGVRLFSVSNGGFPDHITHIRSNLYSLQHDLTFLASSNVKSQCHLLEIKFKDPSNPTLSSKLSHLTNKGGELERLVYKILDNRLRYNLAKNRRITKDSNYKYGIVGVSMICVFGSLALSLNPIFLAGCAVGLYFYRVVFKQSMLRKATNLNMENLILENRNNKRKLSFLIKVMLYRLGSLEQDLRLLPSAPHANLHKEQRCQSYTQ